MNTENEYWSQLRTVITKLEIVNSSFGRFSIRLLQFAAVLNVPTFSSQLFFSVKLAYLSFLSPPTVSLFNSVGLCLHATFVLAALRSLFCLFVFSWKRIFC